MSQVVWCGGGACGGFVAPKTINTGNTTQPVSVAHGCAWLCMVAHDYGHLARSVFAKICCRGDRW